MNDQVSSVRGFLDRMLQQGRDLAGQAEDAAARRLGVGDGADERAQMRQTALAAGAAAGVAGLLLGSRGGRRLVRTGALAGGLGLLGKLAWDAWNKGRVPDGPTLDALPEDSPEALRRSETMAWAMIAAAKADGHVDEAEQARIDAALRDLPLEVRATLTTVMMRPADAAAIARRATSDQERREIYAASVALCGTDQPQEQAWLATLAAALGLTTDEARAIATQLGA